MCSRGETRGRHGAGNGDAMRASEERKQDIATDAQQSLPQDQREAWRYQLHPRAVPASQGTCVQHCSIQDRVY